MNHLGNTLPVDLDVPDSIILVPLKHAADGRGFAAFFWGHWYGWHETPRDALRRAGIGSTILPGEWDA